MASKSKWESMDDDSDDEAPKRPSSQMNRISSQPAILAEPASDAVVEDGEIEEDDADGAPLNGKTNAEIEHELREKALSQLRSSKKPEETDDAMEADGAPLAPLAQPSPSPPPPPLLDEAPKRPSSQMNRISSQPAIAADPVPDHRGPIPFCLSQCRNVDEAFENQLRIDEGAYGVVFAATERSTGEKVALKRVKLTKEREGFPITALREVTILLRLKHPNIVNVREVALDRSMQKVYMVMDFAEHDLKGLMDVMRNPFTQSEVKSLMKQLLAAVDYMHTQWIVHRDLKLSNLLYTNRGELKVCDFGLARSYGEPLRAMTSLVVTLWYRAPELLLGCTPLASVSGPQYRYSTPIDMWSCGCIFAEILLDEPLFPGKGEHNQLDLIFKLLGTPSEKAWPGYQKLPGAKIQWKVHPKNSLRSKFASPAKSFMAQSFAGGSGGAVLTDAGYDLMIKLLTYDPDKRITAKDALNHGYFRQHPPPQECELMPTYPPTQDANKKKRRREKTPELLKNDDQDDERRFENNEDRKYTLPTENQRASKEQLLRQLAQMDEARKGR